ncbi:Ig-like domain-containing protein [Paenibacillus sp. HWE-109]|uniref:dockerin type I domain-containing protein n=1 Tax=Paenibacillus sp. HWE-109 TaxID=1306526 RepID=UPI001EDFF769|nr:dockerin type I domain-containing protein [Paenibacillus sp. HWE-109]UKS24790.1 Ig-like domain-containing protein [Paenibacillus sp. HWE-109]
MAQLLKRVLIFGLLLVWAFAGLKAEPVQAATEWKDVGSINEGGIISGSTIASYNGSLYTAYIQKENNTPRVKVKKFNGTTWEPVGSEYISDDTHSHIYAVKMSISKGNIYVAYTAKTNQMDKLYVKMYDGSSWSLAGNTSFQIGTVMNMFSLYADDGVPYISISSGKVTVMKLEEGTWKMLGNAQLGEQTQANDLYVYQGIPYVVYQDINPKSIVVEKLNGNTWERVGGRYAQVQLPSSNPFFIDFVQNPKIYIEDGTPYVAYNHQNSSNNQYVNVRKYNGSEWVSVGAANFSEVFPMNINFVKAKDSLYVSYFKIEMQGAEYVLKTFVHQYVNGNWTIIGNNGTFPNNGGELPLYGNNSAIYAAYSPYDPANPNSAKLVLKAVPFGLQVSTFAPSANATNVPLKTGLNLTFSENVTAVNGKNIVIRKSSDNSEVERIAVNDAQKVTILGNTVKIQPKPLGSGTHYDVFIEAGAFQNQEGSTYEGISSPGVWSFKTLVMGDLNGDGKVMPADILIVNQYLLGKISLTAEQLEVADMNGDGIVNTADTAIMLNIYLGRQ